MKVFLITAPLGRPEPVVYPLGPAYLAASLRGLAVAGYDSNLPGNSFEAGLYRAVDFGADLLGISFRNVDTTQERDLFTYYPPFLEAVASARAALPQARVVVGGAAFSMYPDRIMADAVGVDIGVVGEGEEAFTALAAGADESRVPGVYYRRDGRVFFSGPRPRLDFAAAPPADRSVFDVRAYLREPFVIGVQTRRGCPRQCVYCTYPQLEGPVLRTRAAADVVTEMEALRLAGVETVTFVDSLWAVPVADAKALCREIIRRRLDLKWKAYFDEKTFDDELADLALEAGAAEFTFSPDAAADEVLATIGKAIRAGDLYHTLAVLRPRPRAMASYSFFINPPGQTVKSFLAVVNFYLAGKRELGGRFLGASFGNIRLEAGTPALARAHKAGLLPPDADLLPRTVPQLAALFYHETAILKLLSRVYVIAWRAKKLLARLIGRQ